MAALGNILFSNEEYICQFLIDTTPPALCHSLMPLRLAQSLGSRFTGDWIQHVACLITSFTFLSRPGKVWDCNKTWCYIKLLLVMPGVAMDVF